MIGLSLAERGVLPDPVLRLGIRRLLRSRLRDLPTDCQLAVEENEAFRAECRRGPIALVPERANEQHYEVPAAFFEHVLGPRLKYSCGYWPTGVEDLAAAERAMLALTCQRADLADGLRVLDLGCGWGSLTLWIAEAFPHATVLAVSNSKGQREFIQHRCDVQGLTNVEVVTADVNEFEPDRVFDRVVSVEMFEHVRNHVKLLQRIDRWLAPGGRLFVHHFSHRQSSYPYLDASDDDWMTRHFFEGGMMPADDHLLHCQDDLVVDRHWRVNGTHYQRTSEAWLAQQDARRDQLVPILTETYGAADAERWFQRWRLFFLACAELFGTHGGNEWFVTHLRFAKRADSRGAGSR